jgi:hypothetical protein
MLYRTNVSDRKALNRGYWAAASPNTKPKFKNHGFVGKMISSVLSDLLCSRNQSLKSSDDYYVHWKIV